MCLPSRATSPDGDPVEALGDEHRRSILRLLSGGRRSVGEIAAELPISRPAVSRGLPLTRGLNVSLSGILRRAAWLPPTKSPRRSLLTASRVATLRRR
jgi:DNA-binding transcriptional ArsR family regulator